MIDAALGRFVEESASEDAGNWDRKFIATDLMRRFLISAPDIEHPDKVPDSETLSTLLHEAGSKAFDAKLASWDELGKRHGIDRLPEKVLSQVILRVLDEKWKDHLFELDHLRSGIYYRSLGQKDPLIEYKKEAFEMFVDLMHDIRSTFSDQFFKYQLHVGAAPPRRQGPPPQAQAARDEEPPSEADLMVPGAAKYPRRPPAMVASHGDDVITGPKAASQQTVPKVGRNDPCPCGSGKKYKKCHGRAV